MHTCDLVLGSLRKEATKFNASIDFILYVNSINLLIVYIFYIYKKTGKERGKEEFCEADCL